MRMCFLSSAFAMTHAAKKLGRMATYISVTFVIDIYKTFFLRLLQEHCDTFFQDIENRAQKRQKQLLHLLPALPLAYNIATFDLLYSKWWGNRPWLCWSDIIRSKWLLHLEEDIIECSAKFDSVPYGDVLSKAEWQFPTKTKIVWEWEVHKWSCYVEHFKEENSKEAPPYMLATLTRT